MVPFDLDIVNARTGAGDSEIAPRVDVSRVSADGNRATRRKQFHRQGRKVIPQVIGRDTASLQIYYPQQQVEDLIAGEVDIGRVTPDDGNWLRERVEDVSEVQWCHRVNARREAALEIIAIFVSEHRQRAFKRDERVLYSAAVRVAYITGNRIVRCFLIAGEVYLCLIAPVDGDGAYRGVESIPHTLGTYLIITVRQTRLSVVTVDVSQREPLAAAVAGGNEHRHRAYPRAAAIAHIARDSVSCCIADKVRVTHIADNHDSLCRRYECVIRTVWCDGIHRAIGKVALRIVTLLIRSCRGLSGAERYRDAAYPRAAQGA